MFQPLKELFAGRTSNDPTVQLLTTPRQDISLFGSLDSLLSETHQGFHANYLGHTFQVEQTKTNRLLDVHLKWPKEFWCGSDPSLHDTAKS